MPPRGWGSVDMALSILTSMEVADVAAVLSQALQTKADLWDALCACVCSKMPQSEVVDVFSKASNRDFSQIHTLSHDWQKGKHPVLSNGAANEKTQHLAAPALVIHPNLSNGSDKESVGI